MDIRGGFIHTWAHKLADMTGNRWAIGRCGCFCSDCIGDLFKPWRWGKW